MNNRIKLSSGIEIEIPKDKWFAIATDTTGRFRNTILALDKKALQGGIEIHKREIRRLRWLLKEVEEKGFKVNHETHSS